MPVNRLQQALMRAAAPRVTRVERTADDGNGRSTQRVHLSAPGLRGGHLPMVHAAGQSIPVIGLDDDRIVLAPLASQLGCEAEVDFGDGQVARVNLSEGRLGKWSAP